MGKKPKQFVVIGAGKFGSSVAIALSKKGCEVTVIDVDKEKIRQISEYVSQAIQLDAMDEKALKSTGIDGADVAIVSIGQEMEASILVTMALKEMGIKTVIAKGLTEAHGKVLARIGADRIVFPEREMGEKLANVLVSPTILDHIEVSPGYTIVEVGAPEILWGKSLAQTKIRTKYGVDIVAVKKSRPGLDKAGESSLKEEVNIAPSATTVIEQGDVLIVIGREADINKFKDIA